MKIYDKLRLVRGLYCLSQEEMASLGVTVQRSVYAAAEVGLDKPKDETKKRGLAKHYLETLERELRFDESWLMHDECVLPLIGQRFLFLDLDWSNRFLAVPPHVRGRCFNEAVAAVKALLPQMLEENTPVSSVVATAEHGGKASLLLFNEGEHVQGLLLKTVPGQLISDVVDEIVGNATPMSISDDEFQNLARCSADAVMNLFRACQVADNALQEIFLPAIKDQAVNAFNYTARFMSSTSQSFIKRVYKEMLRIGLSVEQVSAGLAELKETNFKP